MVRPSAAISPVVASDPSAVVVAGMLPVSVEPAVLAVVSVVEPATVVS